MKRRSEQVCEFTGAVALAQGLALPAHPIKMSQLNVEFISKMVMDELEELAEAKTKAEQFDALEDIKYYIDDCLAKHGVDGDALFDVVHAANMAKLVDGQVLLDTDRTSPRFGKVLKPEGWTAPDIESEIRRQENV